MTIIQLQKIGNTEDKAKTNTISNLITYIGLGHIASPSGHTVTVQSLPENFPFLLELHCRFIIRVYPQNFNVFSMTFP